VANACLAAHGFAVIKGLLDDEICEKLRRDVGAAIDPDNDLAHGESRTNFAFVESSPTLRSLLDNQSFMEVRRTVTGSDELTINRSAAVIRKPGSQPVRWHTDWCGFNTGSPASPDEVLNRGPWPSDKWFYLTGSRPTHGGLAVIADSHVEDWGGATAFCLRRIADRSIPKVQNHKPTTVLMYLASYRSIRIRVT